MAITATAHTVSTTAVLLSSTDNDRTAGPQVWVYGEYHGGSSKIAIGPAGVTMSTGIHIYGGETFGPIHLSAGDELYAISDASPGLDVRVLEVGE